MSGWMLGEKHINGKTAIAEASHAEAQRRPIRLQAAASRTIVGDVPVRLQHA